MRCVILLRGVNVGGNNRVPRQEFRAALESIGLTDVVVYLNSGNAVATSDRSLGVAEVRSALEEHFGFSIPTLLLPAEKVVDVANAIPPNWTNDTPSLDKTGQKSDVLYLFSEIDHPGVLDEIGYNPDVETMIYVDGAVLANVSRANQSKGSLQKLVGTKLYAHMTVRNVNTARKLAELVSLSSPSDV